MDRLLSVCERVLSALAGICMVMIMLLVAIDACGRYLFNAPLQWSNNFVTFYLLVALFFLPLATTAAHGDHLRIDFFYRLFGRKLRIAFDLITTTLSIAAFGAIAYLSAKTAFEAWSQAEYLPGYIRWPTWPSSALVPIGTAVLIARLLATVIHFRLLGRSALHEPGETQL